MWPRISTQKGTITALCLENRKRLALCSIRGPEVKTYGYFTSTKAAQDFFNDLAEILETQKGE